MTTLFISDLHLDVERPEITELFGEFIEREARKADALYILGDLFEAWVGDDDPSEAGKFVAAKLKALTDSGVPVYFIRGNRDFLIGNDYAYRSGMTILPDPAVILLHGTPTLIGHGDLLCTDDIAYQQFRAQTRDPRWQAQFLAQPLDARLAFAAQARAASQARFGELQATGLSETITDVSPETVAGTFSRYGIAHM
ncbi:MAG: UDP-2,3-diacylglucosamine diphosphatase, partial [Thermomonas sp.]